MGQTTSVTRSLVLPVITLERLKDWRGETGLAFYTLLFYVEQGKICQLIDSIPICCLFLKSFFLDYKLYKVQMNT